MKEPTRISKMRRGRCGKLMAGVGGLMFVLILVASQAQAVVLDTGNQNFSARFDNTVTYSLVSRVASQNETMMANPFTDDAERSFDTGLVMNRFDLFSELELLYKTQAANKFGVRVSGAGWYDFVYNTDNDNDSPETVNHTSVAYNEFTDEVKRWHGRNAELLDLYTIGAVGVGDMTLRYRAGQFAQMWGKAFFPPFGFNGITGALAPLNVSKVATVPNAEFKEFIMPVPQATADLQVTDNVSIGAVYQFEWEPNRLFAAGSYFSPADFIGPLGAELGPAFAGRIDDVEASDSGQYGVRVNWVSPWNMDLGFYYLNVHSREFYMLLGLEGDVTDPTTWHPGYYYYLYPEDIEYYGITADTNVGDYPLSVEVTYRRNAPLALSSDFIFLPFQSPATNDDAAFYPVGQTLHVVLNSFSGGMAGDFFCDSKDLIVEIGFDYLVTVDKNEEMLADAEDLAIMAQIAYTPKWYQVFPGWDIYLPMGIAYSFEGTAAGMQGGTMGNDKGGSWNIGVQPWYNGVWKMGLTYTDYFGDLDVQPHKDRDTLAFYITKSF